MTGGLAAAQVVVVQRRQVVVNQRIGVEHFERAAQVFDPGGKIAGKLNHAGGLHRKRRAQSLASGKNAVAHGSMNGHRLYIRARQQSLERGVGERGSVTEDGVDIRRHAEKSYRSRMTVRALVLMQAMFAPAQDGEQQQAKRSNNVGDDAIGGVVELELNVGVARGQRDLNLAAAGVGCFGDGLTVDADAPGRVIHQLQDCDRGLRAHSPRNVCTAGTSG